MALGSLIRAWADHNGSEVLIPLLCSSVPRAPSKIMNLFSFKYFLNDLMADGLIVMKHDPPEADWFSLSSLSSGRSLSDNQKISLEEIIKNTLSSQSCLAGVSTLQLLAGCWRSQTGLFP